MHDEVCDLPPSQGGGNMSRPILFLLGSTVALSAILSAASAAGPSEAQGERPNGAASPAALSRREEWSRSCHGDKANWASAGRNPYFVLEPGYRLHFAHGKATLTVSVLDETKTVDGVETRVVEEREEKNGQLAEISRNYFAIDESTSDVYYFGEDSSGYRNGKVVSREGSWLSGSRGATFGLMMPGRVAVGDRYYQEIAPEVALDRAQVVAVGGQIETPAGTFKGCVRMKETSALEMGSSEKWYAPEVGLVRDDDLVLVKVERRSR
jgi:hypothetical protein